MASFPLFPLLACSLIACYGFQGALAQSQAKKDQARILNCVGSVLADDWYGFLDITGDDGFQLLIGNSTVVAGGRIGKGRVIGAGHHFLLKSEPHSEKNSDRAIFLQNMVRWVSNYSLDTVAIALRRAGLEKTREPLKKWFKNVIELKQSDSDIATTHANVIILDSYFQLKYTSALINRIKKGMGVIIMTANWSWFGNFNTADFKTKYTPNVIARKAGFEYRHSDSCAGDGADKNRLFPAIKYKCNPTTVGRGPCLESHYGNARCLDEY